MRSKNQNLVRVLIITAISFLQSEAVSGQYSEMDCKSHTEIWYLDVPEFAIYKAFQKSKMQKEYRQSFKSSRLYFYVTDTLIKVDFGRGDSIQMEWKDVASRLEKDVDLINYIKCVYVMQEEVRSIPNTVVIPVLRLSWLERFEYNFLGERFHRVKQRGSVQSSR